MTIVVMILYVVLFLKAADVFRFKSCTIIIKYERVIEFHSSYIYQSLGHQNNNYQTSCQKIAISHDCFELNGSQLEELPSVRLSFHTVFRPPHSTSTDVMLF